MMMRAGRLSAPFVLLAATSCGGGDSNEMDAGANTAAVGAAETPEDAAALAQDPELANDAAAAEAADMEAYGGNAAALGGNAR